MQNQYKNFILFPLIFISFCLLGQKDSMPLPTEEVTLHTDRNLYLTNEKVYFKAFCLTEGVLESPLSKILYVELFNHKNQVFVQKKYALKGGVAQGSIIVPEELPTNNYYLRAYTAYQRNFDASIYYLTTLKIINPKSAGISIAEGNDIKSNNDRIETNNLVSDTPLSISTDKKNYSPREKVNLNIDFPTDFVSASVSVRPMAAGISTNNFLRPQSANLKEDTLKYLPELRGFGIYGLLQNPETQEPLADIQCIISALGEKAQIHATQTNEEGIFTFQLSNLQEVQTLFVGTPKEKTAAELLILSDFANDFSGFEKELLSFDSLQHAYIEDLFLQQQLSKAFPAKALKQVYPEDTIQTFSNFSQPDITIQIADYIGLASVEEIFRDIIPAVSVKGRANERTLTIFSPETKQTLNNPLVLLDNVPIVDIEALLKINPVKLERIDVITSNYILGDYLFSGIISLYTNTNNFADYKWSNASSFVEYTAVAASESFKQVIYEEQNKTSSYPDFRSTLYWNSHLNQKNSELSFYTSDYCTEYEVIVRGFDKNGNYGEEKARFLVKK